MTLIVRRQDAQRAGLSFEYPCRMITLSIHSSLEAVGFMAHVSTLLADAESASILWLGFIMTICLFRQRKQIRRCQNYRY